jgi:hypothetical protein
VLQTLELLNGYIQRERLLVAPETLIRPSKWGNDAGAAERGARKCLRCVILV